MGIAPIKEEYSDLKGRGVRVRFITEITSENMQYVKELMNYAEVRHMDTVKGNMAVSETEYVATATLEGAKPIMQTIYSKAKPILEQQRYFFENLWTKAAVHADQKIREIEEGVEPEFFEVINEKNKTAELLLSLSKLAKKEVLFLLPNDKALVRMKKLGVLDALQKASLQGVNVRLICPVTDANSEIVEWLSRISDKICQRK